LRHCEAYNTDLHIFPVQDVERGPDLFELVELLLALGNVTQAVNLDGGGSAVSVYDGQVISRPTCTDTRVVCERPVTSITCIKGEREYSAVDR
jgi:exopolysaccharide biosynthesis protein